MWPAAPGIRSPEMVRAANARRAGLSLDAWRLPGPDAASPLSAARSLLCAPLRAARRARSAARQLFRQGPPIRQGGTVSAFGAPSRKGVVAGATSCGSHTSGAGTACWATAALAGPAAGRCCHCWGGGFWGRRPPGVPWASYTEPRCIRGRGLWSAAIHIYCFSTVTRCDTLVTRL